MNRVYFSNGYLLIPNWPPQFYSQPYYNNLIPQRRAMQPDTPTTPPLTNALIIPPPLKISIPKHFDILYKDYQEYRDQKCIKFIEINYKCQEINIGGQKITLGCSGEPSSQEWPCKYRRILRIKLTVNAVDPNPDTHHLLDSLNCFKNAPNAAKKFDEIVSLDAGRVIRDDTMEKARLDAVNTYIEEVRNCIPSEHRNWFNTLKFSITTTPTIIEDFKNITPDPPLPPNARPN
ncbi:hypothetical protein [Cohnella sp. JJ-181]|uniref:hypothetical protein n=1 Tax=Cohnella rhizoplanae TaxID=2974897 RepID=UPI0022FF9B84|nr:hypothetical protein [Cohnella sp. JJ-181]CAI6086732.1 hypothetical protein COHCIP112018_05150 [Cohnella sp. JJ-181]